MRVVFDYLRNHFRVSLSDGHSYTYRPCIIHAHPYLVVGKETFGFFYVCLCIVHAAHVQIYVGQIDFACIHVDSIVVVFRKKAFHAQKHLQGIVIVAEKIVVVAEVVEIVSLHVYRHTVVETAAFAIILQ